MNTEQAIQEAARALDAADALLIAAGAGMGVDSGLPDFRGTQGFWRAYPAVARMGLSFEKLANPVWFKKDPCLAWAFYGHRLNLYRTTEPHEGFQRLLEIGARKTAGYFVFTSNVDGQFQKAGYEPERIVECHGSIQHFQCSVPCAERIWEAQTQTVIIDEENFRALEPLPKCPNCGALARPNILMFGDWSWLVCRTNAQQERLSCWLNELADRALTLVVVEIGAGSAIPTVRHFSERLAGRFNGRLIRINPREAAVPSGQMSLPFGAAEGIQRVCEAAGISSANLGRARCPREP